ncbi:MSC_0882 family membrane protein [Mycoplasma sp. 'Moose RK']|uniref:MSC_0882 family membrane protein n=1 Tax=Mycoplasma sp. 'Moose RK' TaxID=2780095 RepID=UPI0018C2E294|nr:hypothetical protein [Mycoplasma sp. 'Moose RK']MBG0730635.1 hypothetical protein [Mycoplasma sp. 'Moose RK']
MYNYLAGIFIDFSQFFRIIMRHNRPNLRQQKYPNRPNNRDSSRYPVGQRRQNYYQNQQDYQYEDFGDDFYENDPKYRTDYHNSPRYYQDQLTQENFHEKMEQKWIQDESNTFISREVRKIFGLELIFLPIKAVFWFCLILAVAIVSVLWQQQQIPQWTYRTDYLPLLVIPGIICAILLFLFVRTLLDYNAVKKSVAYFRSQLKNNSNRLEMPPMILWLVKKVNLKEVNAIWLSIFTFLLTTIMGINYWLMIKYLPSNNIQNSVEYITGMVVSGVFFITMLFYDLMLRRRLSNIEAIFGHVYHKHIDISRIRFRRHLVWAFFTIIVFFILRRVGRNRKLI